MSAIQISSNPGEERRAETACGALITVTPNTPYIHYRDQIVYFCGQDCLELYQQDPSNSCMAARLLSDR